MILLKPLEMAWRAVNRMRRALYRAGFLKPARLPRPVISVGNNTTWHQFSIRTPRRDALQPFLKERGVDSMIYYPVPIHFHEPYKQYGLGKGSLPVTELACLEILNLPIHQHLSDEQVRHAAECVREFVTAMVTA